MNRPPTPSASLAESACGSRGQWGRGSHGGSPSSGIAAPGLVVLGEPFGQGLPDVLGKAPQRGTAPGTDRDSRRRTTQGSTPPPGWEP